MTRLFLFILLIIMLIATGTVFAEGQELYSNSWNNGVVVVLYGTQYGTGWWINKYYLVTAGHVVNYQSRIQVTIMHGDYVAKATVVYVDQVHDIALLRASNPPAQQYVFKLSAKAPEKGETVFVIGYPFELYKIVGDLQKMSANPRVTQGIVSWSYHEKQLFEFSASTDAGNSGGPIVDAYGNVIGLVSFALQGEAATMYYGSSVEAIKWACQQAGVQYYTSLSSSILNNINSNTGVVQPALVAAVVGGLAAAITTAVIVPVARGKKR